MYFCIINVILLDFVTGHKEINEMNIKTNNESGITIGTRFLNDVDIKKNATHIDFGLTIKKRSGIILGVCGLTIFIIVIALCCYIRSLRKKRR